jgi:predicted enzyme related to lactoylglutathione lyase/predicted 3-demethylubiquinone-9 3-methyltransferase (glyoxalase superfamily)
VQKIKPFLWFDGQAEEAMNHYTSIFKNARVISVSRSGDADRTGEKGKVFSCTFELEGLRIIALNGGPMYKFNEAMSLFVSCQTQAEVDELWTKLSAGGSESKCGWLKDKFGVSWQIIPDALGEMLADKDPQRAQRVMQAMLQMSKIDIAALRRAYDGAPAGSPEHRGAGGRSSANRFVWYDLMTSDTKAAEAFYRKVVGWEAKDSGMPGSYTLFSVGSTMVAGLMPIPEDARQAGVGPAWMGYVGVDDIDVFIARVRQAGGAIHKGPQSIPGVGRFAVAGDRQGAGFMLFEPGAGQEPAPLAPGTPGHVGWHELYAGDLEGAFLFYSGLFGWTKGEVVATPAGPYQLFATGGAAVGGMMTKPKQAERSGWLFYFNVDAIDAAVERIRAADGTIVHGPMPVPGGSFIVQARDPQGALFALVASKR